MLIYPFILPTPSQVRIESRLRPEQVSTAFATAADLEVDIATRIPRKADIVGSRLRRVAAPYQWPFTDAQLTAAYANETSDIGAADTQEQLELATEATQLYTLASLYGSAGQLNKMYFTRSTEYKDEADAILRNLSDAIKFVRDRLEIQDGRGEARKSNSGTGSATINAVW